MPRRINGWHQYYQLKHNVLVEVTIIFNPTLDEIPDLDFKSEPEPPRYNLNLGRMVDRLIAVHECRIACALRDIPFLDLCHKMPIFSADQIRKRLCLESSLDIPILPADVGEVYQTLTS